MLLLFDIDGTLVSGATGAHPEAMYAALPESTGSTPRRIARSDRGGRTDGEIARAILLDAGISAERIDERAEDLRDECCRATRDAAPGPRDTVLPGVPELLARLRRGRT